MATTDPTPAVTAGEPLTDEQVAGAATTPTDEAPKPSRSRSRSSSTRTRSSSSRSRSRSSSSSSDAAPRTRTTTRRAPIAPRVEGLHIMLGMGASFAPQPAVKAAGAAMADNAKNIGEAWESYAKNNPKVREWLERLLTVSDVGALLGAYLPVIIAAMGASGTMPAGLMVPPQSAPGDEPPAAAAA